MLSSTSWIHQSAPSRITCSPVMVAITARRSAPVTLAARSRPKPVGMVAARPSLLAVLTACTARLLGRADRAPNGLDRFADGHRDADPAARPQDTGQRQLARGETRKATARSNEWRWVTRRSTSCWSASESTAKMEPCERSGRSTPLRRVRSEVASSTSRTTARLSRNSFGRSSGASCTGPVSITRTTNPLRRRCNPTEAIRETARSKDSLSGWSTSRGKSASR